MLYAYFLNCFDVVNKIEDTIIYPMHSSEMNPVVCPIFYKQFVLLETLFLSLAIKMFCKFS